MNVRGLKYDFVFIVVCLLVLIHCSAVLAGTPSLKAQAHVQNIGNMKQVEMHPIYDKSGKKIIYYTTGIIGTTGRGLRVEAIRIWNTYGMQYRAHVQNIGWQGWKSAGAEAGTTGRGLRMEALKIKTPNIDFIYRAHIQNIGWEKTWHHTLRNDNMNEYAGTTGRGLRLEAIEIRTPEGYKY